LYEESRYMKSVVGISLADLIGIHVVGTCDGSLLYIIV